MNVSWQNTDQAPVSSRWTYFYRSYSPLKNFGLPDFSAVFWDIDWNLVHLYMNFSRLIQIKFQVRHACPTFTGVIALCTNLVFRTFLCSLIKHWLQIWYMNWSWLNTDQVRGWSRLTYFYTNYCPLLKFSFSDFSLVFWYIDLKCGIWICLHVIQVKSNFCFA